MPLGFCPAILLGLEQAAKDNDPQFKQTATGTLTMLQQPENASIEIKGYDAGDGHHVDVRYKYIPRSTQSEVLTSRTCDTEPEKPYKEGLLQISEYRGVKVGLSMDTIAKYCSDASDLQQGKIKGVSPIMAEVNKRIMLKMNALRTSINGAVLVDIKNNYGSIGGFGSGTKSVKLIHNGSSGIVAGAPVYQGFQEMMYDYMNSEMINTPLIAGFGNFAKFDASTRMAGGLQNSGLDFSGIQQNYKFFPDLQADSILGANNITVLAPGSAQLVTYNKYRGNFSGKFGATELGILPDPLIPNLFYDVQLDFDSCNTQWNLIIGVTFGVWTVPADAYSYPDRMLGVNGLFSYKADTIAAS